MDLELFEKKITSIRNHFEELEKQMVDPVVINDRPTYTRLAQEHSDLEPLVKAIDTYFSIKKQLEDDRQILESQEDEELVELVREEIPHLEEKLNQLIDEIRMMLIPPDPNDEKNVIMEIRAGTGGDEAAIFAGDLFRMYTRFFEKKRWKFEIVDANPSERGGYKEIILAVSGHRVYSQLKYENGVHRVQRVPETESQGRVHTSAASVVVMPEAEDVDVEIRPEEIRIDVFRASGHGGQHVNTTDSAVRITHLPTGIVVSCQDEKSQLKNKEKALKVLKARLLDKYRQEQQQSIDSTRKLAIGSGDRSEKIRTYNFPQNRVTDHRINLTLYSLNEVMDGELDELIEQLQLAERTERLEKEAL